MVAVGAMLVLVVFAEAVVPITMARANDIWLREVRREHTFLTRDRDIWLKGDRTITHIRHYDAEKQTAFGVTHHELNANFELDLRIDARQAAFRDDRWVLSEVLVQQRLEEEQRYTVRNHERLDGAFTFQPDDLRRVIKKSEEMTFQELRRFIRKVEAEGYDATVYRVDLHAKAAFPFVCLIMVLVGTGTGLRGRTQEGLSVGVAYGLGIAFMYWIFHSFAISLGYAEMLPPVLAAWVSNLVFGCVGLLSLMHAQ
jgi:lipopolysaccharide export system permease protein